MQSITKNWFPPTIPSDGPSSAEIDTEASFDAVAMVLPEACCRQECYDGPTSKHTILTFVESSATSGPRSIIDVVAMVLPEACYRQECYDCPASKRTTLTFVESSAAPRPRSIIETSNSSVGTAGYADVRNGTPALSTITYFV